jgi:hypothetical protein
MLTGNGDGEGLDGGQIVEARLQGLAAGWQRQV